MLAEPNFERRLDELCQGLPPYIKRHLLGKISRENTSTIIEYIDAIRMEGTNLSIVYKQAVVDTLTSLAKFHPGFSKTSPLPRSRPPIPLSQAIEICQ
jgi:hypothetical protein